MINVSMIGIEKDNIEEVLCLSPMQEALLFQYIYNRNSNQYHRQATYTFRGVLNKEIFYKSWNYIAELNEMLRTVFRWEGLEKPVQIILKKFNVNVVEYDLSTFSYEKKKEILEDIKEKDKIQKVNICEEPYSIIVCKLESDKFEVILSNHYILFDEWSNIIILEDFIATYNALASGKKVELPKKKKYRDFIDLYNKLDKENQDKFWEKYFDGFKIKTNLPYDRKKHKEVENVNSYDFVLENNMTENIFKLEKTISYEALFYTAWGILLQRYNNSEDVVFGTIEWGRDGKCDEFLNTVGLLINNLPLRIDLSGVTFIYDLINNVEMLLSKRREFQHTAFSDIMTHSHFNNSQLLFDSVVGVQRFGLKKNSDITGISVENTSMFEITNFDIVIEVIISGTISIHFIYNTDVFENETIKRLSGHFRNVINVIVNNLEIEVSRVELLTEYEKKQIKYGFNNSKTLFPDNLAVHEVFEEKVKNTPENKALSFNGFELTYKELDEKANQLAWFIRSKGIIQNSIVAIIFKRSIEMIVSILAILKAGGAYLPIDPMYPIERIDSIIEDSGAKLVLTQKNIFDQANISENGMFHRNNIELVFLNDVEYLLSQYEKNYIQNINVPGDVAYVLYTSGSTGKPKGTLITHYNICSKIVNANFIDVKQNDRVLQLSNYIFDGSAFDIFNALLNGAQLVLIDQETSQDAIKLAEFIKKHDITLFFVITPLFNTLVDLDIECLKNVRRIYFGGERASALHVNKAYKYLGSGRIINVYGPTECTMLSSSYLIDYMDEDCDDVPIGIPTSNAQIYILDLYGNIQPIGAYGELCICGEGVGKGYLNRNDLTLERFVANPFDKQGVMYRTGDLATWDSKGILHFMGRIDNQVKVRGYRIELGEVENCLLGYDGIKEVVVLAKEDTSFSNYLCAFFTSNEIIDTFLLKEYLSSKLPDYMIPMYFIRVDKMPLTPSGKIDRKLLPEPQRENDTVKHSNILCSLTEMRLLELFREVLDLYNIDVNDNFFEMGGHSLKATVLALKIQKEFNIEISLSMIFKMPTIRSLADFVENSKAIKFTSIVPIERKEYYALSYAQKRIFLTNQELNNTDVAYNNSAVIAIEGAVDKKRIEDILIKLIERHESLRTSFHIVNGEPIQIIHDKVNFKMDYIESEENLFNNILDTFIKPFDLLCAPLFRAVLVSLGDNKYKLMLDMHHIISDGTSLGVLLKEFYQLYKSECLPELKIQYKDFSEWQNKLLESDYIKDQEEYWISVFSDGIPVLNLPTDYPRPPIKSFEGSRILFELDTDLSVNLKKLAVKTGTTLYILLLSGFNILLSKYTSQQDIVIGSATAGRHNSDLNDIIGMFVNTVAIRSYPNAEKSFITFLEEEKDIVLRAFDNQNYQFQELVRKLGLKRELSRNPIFDVMFELQNMDIPLMKSEDISIVKCDFVNKGAKFDILFEILEKDNTIMFNIEYCSKLFYEETIRRMGMHYINILTQIVNNPDLKISDINIISDVEREQILNSFNNTTTVYDDNKMVHNLFEEQVERTPDSIALIFGDEKLTYRELDNKSSGLAALLKDRGINNNSIIGIMMNRSIEMIVAIMSVLKAGAAYLPIDPIYPKERIKYMLEDSEAKILLTNFSSTDKLEYNVEIININDFQIDGSKPANIQIHGKSTDLAYIIYTSGSTGNPKGVMIEHKALVNFIEGVSNRINFTSYNTILALTTISFDIFVLETLLPLSKGLKVVISEESHQKNPEMLNKIIIENEIDIIQMTPSRMLLLLSDKGCVQALKKLECIMIGGEALPRSLLNEVKKYSNAKIYNMYGPTETTVWSTIKELTNSDDVNIGKPIANTYIYIADKYNNLQPIGVPGELYISGDGLARGYFKRAELTDEKFIINPFYNNSRLYKTGDMARWLINGDIEFLGRFDHQVKIRGFRVELGEIESCLLSYKIIKEAAVIDKEDISGSKYICAYLVVENNFNLSELKDFLLKKLPDYMIPSYFVQLEFIPKTPNGKIDRKSLPEKDSITFADSEYVEAESELESKIVVIWEMVLGKEKIGINDDFFALGGHSILAIKLEVEMEKNDLSIEYLDIYKYKTVKELAKYITSKGE